MWVWCEYMIKLIDNCMIMYGVVLGYCVICGSCSVSYVYCVIYYDNYM